MTALIYIAPYSTKIKVRVGEGFYIFALETVPLKLQNYMVMCMNFEEMLRKLEAVSQLSDNIFMSFPLNF